MNWRTLLLASALTLAAPMAWATNLQPESTWAVTRIGAKGASSAPYCALARRFQNNIIMTFARNTRDETSVAIDFQQPVFSDEQSVTVNLNTGGPEPRSFILKPASNKAVVARIGADPQFFKELESSQALNVTVLGQDYNFMMADIAQADSQMNTCLSGLAAPLGTVPAGTDDKIAALQDQISTLKTQRESMASGLNETDYSAQLKAAAGSGSNADIAQKISELQMQNLALRGNLESQRGAYDNLQTKTLEDKSRLTLLEETQDQLRRAEEETKKFRDDLYMTQTRQDELLQKLDKYSDAEQKRKALEGHLAEVKAENERIVVSLTEEKDRLELVKSAQDAVVAQQEEELTKTKSQLAQTSTERDGLKTRLQEYSGIKDKLMALAAQQQELGGTVEQLQTERKDLTSKLTDERAKLEDIQQAKKKLEEQNASSEEEKTRLAKLLEEEKVKQEAVKELESSLNDLKAKQDELATKVAGLEGEKKTLQGRVSDLEAKVKTAEDEKQKLSADLDTSKAEKEKLATDLSLTQAEKEKLVSTLDEAKVAKEKLASDLTLSKAEKEQLANTLDEAKIAKEKLAADLSLTKAEKEKLATDLSLSKAEKDRLASTLDEEKAAKEKLAADLEAEKANKEKLASALDSTKADKDKLASALSETEASKTQLQSAIEAVKADKEKLAGEVTVTKADKEKLETRKAELEKSLKDIEEAKAKLTAALDENKTRQATLEESLKSAQTDKAKTEEILKGAQDEQQKLAKTLDETKTAKNELEGRLKAEQEAKTKLAADLEAEKANREKLAADLESTKADKEKLAGALDATKADKDKLATALTETEANKTQLQTALNDIKTEKEKLAADLGSSKSDKDKLAESLKLAEARKTELEKSLKDIEGSKTELAKALDDTKARQAGLEEQLKLAQTDKNKTEEILKTAQAEREKLAETMAANDNARAQMEERLAAADAEKQKLVVDLNTARSEKVAMNEALDDADEIVTHQAGTIDAMTMKQKDLLSKIVGLETEKKTLLAQMDQQKNQLASLETDSKKDRDFKYDFDRLKEQMADISKERDALRDALGAAKQKNMELASAAGNDTRELFTQMEELEYQRVDLNSALEFERAKNLNDATPAAGGDTTLAELKASMAAMQAERDQYKNLLDAERSRSKELQSVADAAGSKETVGGLNARIKKLEAENVTLLRELEYEKARSLDVATAPTSNVGSADIVTVTRLREEVKRLQKKSGDLETQQAQLLAQVRMLEAEKQKMAQTQTAAAPVNDAEKQNLKAAIAALQTEKQNLSTALAQQTAVAKQAAAVKQPNPEEAARNQAAAQEIAALKTQLGQAQALLAARQAQAAAPAPAPVVATSYVTPQADNTVQTAPLNGQLSPGTVSRPPEVAARPAQNPQDQFVASNPVSTPVIDQAEPMSRASANLEDDIRDMLRQADLGNLSQFGPVSIPVASDVQGWRWKVGHLTGNAESHPAREAQAQAAIIGEFLAKAKSRCPGDFAVIENSRTQSARGLVVSTDIACVSGANGVAAAIAFIQFGDQLVAIAHEADTSGMPEAMMARDKLVKAALGR